MTALNTHQLDTYHRQGYLFPLDVMTRGAALSFGAELDELEQSHSDPGLVARCLRLNAHYTCPFAYRLAVHPEIVAAVESILGPNLLAWGSELFAKDPGSSSYVSWHQDLTYWGLGSTEHEVTAWIALSDVTVENGAMRYLPGSHKAAELLSPIETFATDNALSRGQELPVSVDESQAVSVCLQPGQIALHHGRMFHASGPNESHQRRVGLTIRYITPDVSPAQLGFDYALLVAGENTSSQFELLPPPRTALGNDELERFERVAAHQAALYVKPDETIVPFWDRKS